MKPRPRLADHALLRRHLVDGVERVIVHHARTGALVSLDPRAALIARCADGTRDIDGVALAASRAGAFRRQSEVEALLAGLDEADLLVDGIACGEPAPAHPTTPLPGPMAELDVEVLDGYRFHCSGGGGCCAQYASIVVSDADLDRARAAGLSTLPGDAGQKRVALPLYGGDDTGRSALTLVDGRCLQLLPSMRCGLHERGGIAAKPAACRAYPATYVSDGMRVRVSVAAECDCVLSSVGGQAGEPLATVGPARDLPSGISVRVLPEQVRITHGFSVSRADYRTLAEAALRFAAERAQSCAITLTAALSRAIEGWAPARALEPGLLSAEQLSADLGPVIDRLEVTMRGAVAAADAWRSQRDRTRLLRHAVLAATSAVARRGASATLSLAPFPDAEAFVVRAALFGHQLAGSLPISDALRDLAAQLLVARELSVSRGHALGHPIAVVLAATRGTVVAHNE